MDSEKESSAQPSYSRRLSLAVGIWAALSLSCGAASSTEKPVSFVNDVIPVLTKATCNSGGCHAKAGMGQNGFQLSLLGFEPDEDFEHLVKEGQGRRVFPAAPDRSLLLLKASASIPHGGGKRLEEGAFRGPGLTGARKGRLCAPIPH